MSTSKRKIPIKRINKFFSGRDFDLEIQMGREAIEGDGNIIPIIDKAENKTYNPDSMRYLEDGNLTFIIYSEHLKELNIDITVGDYVAYPIDETDVVYFNVTNAGEKNYDNAHTIMGYKGAYRIINCTFANEDEFSGI